MTTNDASTSPTRYTLGIAGASRLLGASTEDVERLVANGTLRQRPTDGLLDAGLVHHLAFRLRASRTPAGEMARRHRLSLVG